MPLATGMCFPRTEFAGSACEEPTTQLREGVKEGFERQVTSGRYRGSSLLHPPGVARSK